MIEIICSLTNDFSLVGGRPYGVLSTERSGFTTVGRSPEVAPLSCASVAKKRGCHRCTDNIVQIGPFGYSLK